MTLSAATVIVPFRFGNPARDMAWQYVRQWWRSQFEDWPLLVGTCDTKEWRKGNAVDHAVQRACGDGPIIVTDADVLVEPAAIAACLQALDHGAAWAQPHGVVYRLSKTSTTSVYSGRKRIPSGPPMRGMLERGPHPGPCGGGIAVCTREAYMATRGIDPRFTDWGGEDEAWARALDTLAGPCWRGAAPMFHLWHPRMARRPGNRASPENERLASRYLDAVGDVDAMCALVGEW